MRFLETVFLSFILVCFSSVQVAKTEAAVGALQKSHPAARWNNKSATVADVTCDGKPETIILGSEKNSVVIGVVSGANPTETQVFSFPVEAGTQNGFCAVPKRIEVSSLDCKTEGGALPGCEPIKGCQAFSVNDNECDPFNFYWDASRKSLAWWRH